MREWEVVTVRDVERATTEAPGSSAVLIDLGDTDAGVQVADQLYHNGITIPCVVIGDKPVDDPRTRVLVRPFTLEDLGAAVREAAATRSGTTAAPSPPAVTEPVPARPPHRVEHEGNGSASALQEERGQDRLEREPAPEPEPVVAPRTPLKVVDGSAEPEPTSTPMVDRPDPLPAPAFAERESEPAWEEPTTAGTWEETPNEAESAPWDDPAPAVAARAPEPARGWKLRRRPTRTAAPETSSEAPLVVRLKRAAASARELDHLIEQMPFLADIGAMAEGLIGEIDRQFVCAIASVSVRREAGYEVVGSRGLSRVEAGMIIPDTQSLFSDVLKTREGVLIQPVDLAQGLVAGIGGARTEAMMVAPALVNGEVAAMVVVGGERFAEADLDRLTDLAAEAAPGLAVAELLDHLRARNV